MYKLTNISNVFIKDISRYLATFCDLKKIKCSLF